MPAISNKMKSATASDSKKLAMDSVRGKGGKELISNKIDGDTGSAKSAAASAESSSNVNNNLDNDTSSNSNANSSTGISTEIENGDTNNLTNSSVSSKDLKGYRKLNRKDEDPEARKKRVKGVWLSALYKASINIRESQLKKLKDFPFISVEVVDSKKTKFSTARRPADILAEKVLQDKRKQQEEFVYNENLRFQTRIGFCHYHLGNYYKALEYYERVSLKKELKEETEEEKQARLAKEQLERDAAKFEEMQAKMKSKKLKGKKAEEMKQAELEKQVRLAKEAKAAEKEKRKRAKLLAAQGKSIEDEEEPEEINPYHKDYKVHLMAGKCCLRLFEVTKQHYHLEKAYAHFQHSVECMSVPRPGYDLSTMLRLPVVLMELGSVFEHFGAHEAALQMYGKIMQEYPNNRQYFDAMYRAALMGKHLSDTATNETTKVEMLNRCIDMLQFLLEALPHSLNEMQTIFLYAKCLESSSDPAIRYRAKGAFESLFAHCQVSKIANAHEYKSYSEWEKIGENWLHLAHEIAGDHEPLLAKEGYENYVNKVNMKKGFGKELAHYIDTSTLVTIAMNYAHFQNFKEATKYADMALSKDRLNAQVRNLLSKWSKVHAQKLANEVKAVNTLHRRWNERAWTETVRVKLKAQEIVRLEELYKDNRFHPEARQLLSYYNRDEWRSKFLFEAACAVRVQRFMRNKFICWKVQEKFRNVYLSRASQAYSMFNRKPYDPKLRNEIKQICKSRFCPRKHAIRKVRQLLDVQDHGSRSMQRCFRSYRTRRQLIQSMLNTKRKRQELIHRSAIKIQCLVRIKLAVTKVQQVTIYWARKAVAAKVVQKFIRHRNRTFRYTAWRLIYRRRAEKERAYQTFYIVMAYHVKRKLMRKHKHYAERVAAIMKEERIRQYNVALTKRNKSVVIVQRFFRACRARLLSFIASRTIRARRAAGYCASSQHLLNYYFQNILSLKYKPPGIRPNTPAYRLALAQPLVFLTVPDPAVKDNNMHHSSTQLTSTPFTSADIMMLSGLLRHKECQVKTLVLHEIDNGFLSDYEFDLLPAIAVCRSLREIRLLGGTFTGPFLDKLFAIIQTENARVITISCERVRVVRSREASTAHDTRTSEVSSPHTAGTFSEPSRSGSPIPSASVNTKKQLSQQEREEEERIQRLWQAGTTTDKERAAAKAIGYIEKDVRTQNIIQGDIDEEELERMQRIYVKFQQGTKALTAALVGGISRLIKDYFNYSLPGIRVVSLHGSSIRDADMEALCEGISVNTSLKSISLSLNILTDLGFLQLMNTIQKNKKTCIEHIDVSNNLIALGQDVRTLLDHWQPPNAKISSTLHLNLIGNSLVRDYPEPSRARRHKSKTLSIMNIIVPSISEELKKIPPLHVLTSFRVILLPSSQMDPKQFYGFSDRYFDVVSQVIATPRTPVKCANKSIEKVSENDSALNTAGELSYKLQPLSLKPRALNQELFSRSQEVYSTVENHILRTKSAGNI